MFLLAGPYDPDNPSAIGLDQLKKWNENSHIEWLGDIEDMPLLYSKSHFVVFPSYYSEGVPKVLLEASASGRAIITTNMPGCRDVVRHGYNGIIVPPKNVPALVAGIEKLLGDYDTLSRMGHRGRTEAQLKFDEKLVIKSHLEIYQKIQK